MQLHGWYDKACKLLSSTWRVYGAPDSEEVASEGFLTNLASEVGASKDALPGPSAVPPPVGIVTVDEEGFDCRIGKRARKRRREARKIVEPKQKTVNIKAGGGKRKKAKLELKEKAVKQRPPVKSSNSNRSSPAKKGAITLDMLPPGWQIRTEDTLVGTISQKSYYSWDNVKFDTFNKAQRYCTDHNIQMPRQAVPQAESIDEEVSTKHVWLFLVEAGRSGALPTSRSLQLAAIKARQKRYLTPRH